MRGIGVLAVVFLDPRIVARLIQSLVDRLVEVVALHDTPAAARGRSGTNIPDHGAFVPTPIR
jgi:hypothetical protein